MVRTSALIVSAVLAGTGAAASVCAQSDTHSAPIDLIHDKPFVMVMVNGKGPFRFVIDTGTGGEAFVTTELVQQLGLPQAGNIILNDPSGQGGQRVPRVAIDSLRVAGVEFTGVQAAVHNLGNGDGSCQGLLGFALFRDYLLTLDYPNHRMALTSGNLLPDGGKSVLAFRAPDGIPVVTLAVGAQHIDAQLDSGGAGLSLPPQLTAHLKFSSDYLNLSNAHSLSTRFMMRGATLDGDVRLGSYTFRRPFVEINPAFPLANFGSCPMHDFSVTFDQKSGLVRFEAQRRTLRLSATPVPMRLQSVPDREQVDPNLVPAG